MGQSQPSSNSKQNKADKEAYLQGLKEQELREREERLQGHRKYLHEQMMIRKDYYKLGMVHKLIILVLFMLLTAFVLFLVMSYFPPTKSYIFKTLRQVL